MRLACVVGEGNWSFLGEVYKDLAVRYKTTVFEARRLNTPFLYHTINQWLLSFRLNVLLRTNDVAFFEWASEYLVEATRQTKRCPIITRLLGWELYEWAPKVDWSKVDVVIVLLEAVRRNLVQLHPQCEGKVVVINHGVSLDKFHPSPRRFGGVIGTLGYMTPRKRVYELILALYDLAQAGYDFRLCIAGEPVPQFQRDSAAIYRLPAKLGIADRVTFQGYVPEAAEWYRSIDIFVSNSYWETQHVALQEAMASGCYCLAHFWEGAEEFLPQGAIYGTNADLREKIIAYWQMPEDQKHQLQTNLRSIAEKKFDIEQTKERIRAIIEEVRPC